MDTLLSKISDNELAALKEAITLREQQSPYCQLLEITKLQQQLGEKIKLAVALALALTPAENAHHNP